MSELEQWAESVAREAARELPDYTTVLTSSDKNGLVNVTVYWTSASGRELCGVRLSADEERPDLEEWLKNKAADLVCAVRLAAAPDVE